MAIFLLNHPETDVWLEFAAVRLVQGGRHDWEKTRR